MEGRGMVRQAHHACTLSQSKGHPHPNPLPSREREEILRALDL